MEKFHCFIEKCYKKNIKNGENLQKKERNEGKNNQNKD